MGNRDIKDADPRLQRVDAHVQANFAKTHPGLPKVILAEVYRSKEYQTALYAQGREPVARVNSLRRAVGLAPISEQENRRKVTNAKPGKSLHQVKPSRAIDYLFVAGRTIIEDTRYYKALADFIRKFDPSVTWGGDWDGDGSSADESFIDKPHFQI